MNFTNGMSIDTVHVLMKPQLMKILHAYQINRLIHNLNRGMIHLLPANSIFAVLSAKQNQLKTLLIYTCIKKNKI